MKHYFYRDKKRIPVREMFARGWSPAGVRHFSYQADKNKDGQGVAIYKRIEVCGDEAAEHEYICLKADPSWGLKIPTLRELENKLLKESLDDETIFEERPYGYHGQ